MARKRQNNFNAGRRRGRPPLYTHVSERQSTDEDHAVPTSSEQQRNIQFDSIPTDYESDSPPECCGGNALATSDMPVEDQFDSSDCEERERSAALSYANTFRPEAASECMLATIDSEHDGDMLETLSEQDLVAFLLLAGPGHLTDSAYELMRTSVDASAAALSGRVKMTVESKTMLVAAKSLLSRRLIKQEDLSEVLNVLQECRVRPDSDQEIKRLLSDVSLPCIRTMRRKMKAGGVFEQLMLPCEHIFIKQRSTQSDESSPNENSSEEPSMKSGVRNKAGIILLSEHIKRDFASPETYEAILSGVEESPHYRKRTEESLPHFRETDLGRDPEATMRPGAYGVETLPEIPGEWPGLICEGCEILIHARTLQTSCNREVTSEVEIRGELQGQPWLVGGGASHDSIIAGLAKTCSNIDLKSLGPEAIRSGDFVWVLRGSCGRFCLLLYSYWKPEQRVSLYNDGEVYAVQSLQKTKSHENWKEGYLVPKSRTNCSKVNANSTSVSFERNWIDESGLEHLRIFVALFTDDFRLGIGKPNVGGTYVLYLDIPSELRSGAQAARVLSVTPRRGNSDVHVTALLHDFITLHEQGVLCLTPNGEKMQVHVTVSLYVTDYKETAHAGLCRGHSSMHPCTVCAVHRGDSNSSEYHTAQSTSADLSLLRSDARIHAMRSNPGVETEWNDMSLKPELTAKTMLRACEEALAQIPCLNLGKEGRDHEVIIPPMIVYGKAVKGNVFDSFQSLFAGPDHCLFLGIGKDALDLCISLLPSKNARMNLESTLLRLLRIHGFNRPSVILSYSAKASSPTTSLTVSELSAVLAMLPWAMDMFSPENPVTENPVGEMWLSSYYPSLRHHILTVVELLVTTYCAPRVETSTLSECALWKKSVIPKTQNLCRSVIDSARSLASHTHTRVKLEAMDKIMKPNLHRCLEFYLRWFPAIGGDVRNAAELLFEKVHSYMKLHFHQTRAGNEEAWNCIQKYRQRELCERLVTVLLRRRQTDIESRDIVSRALENITLDDEGYKRIEKIVDKLSGSGSSLRGFFVDREAVVWIPGSGPRDAPVFTSPAALSKDAYWSLYDLQKQIYGRAHDLSMEMMGSQVITSAAMRNSSVPHKRIEKGQALTGIHCGQRFFIIVSVLLSVNNACDNNVLCYGERLYEEVSEQFKTKGLRVFHKSGQYSSFQFDSSFRRVAVASWKEGRVSFANITSPNVRSVVIQTQTDGYPLRLA